MELNKVICGEGGQFGCPFNTCVKNEIDTYAEYWYNGVKKQKWHKGGFDEKIEMELWETTVSYWKLELSRTNLIRFLA